MAFFPLYTSATSKLFWVRYRLSNEHMSRSSSIIRILGIKRIGFKLWTLSGLSAPHTPHLRYGNPQQVTVFSYCSPGYFVSFPGKDNDQLLVGVRFVFVFAFDDVFYGGLDYLVADGVTFFIGKPFAEQVL